MKKKSTESATASTSNVQERMTPASRPSAKPLLRALRQILSVQKQVRSMGMEVATFAGDHASPCVASGMKNRTDGLVSGIVAELEEALGAIKNFGCTYPEYDESSLVVDAEDGADSEVDLSVELLDNVDGLLQGALERLPEAAGAFALADGASRSEMHPPPYLAERFNDAIYEVSASLECGRDEIRRFQKRRAGELRELVRTGPARTTVRATADDERVSPTGGHAIDVAAEE